MGLFSKRKSISGLDGVRLYTKSLVKQIEDDRKSLARIDGFDPKNGKHLTLARSLMELTSNLPETRRHDDRSLDWADSKRGNFNVRNRKIDRRDWFSHEQKIYYKDQLVLDWISNSDNGEEFRLVRLGSWCEELFALVLEIRQEIETEVEHADEELDRRKAEFENSRFKRLD